MNWTIISPPKESETANKVQEVISFDYELFRAQNLAKNPQITSSWILYRHRAPALRAVTSELLLEMLCNKWACESFSEAEEKKLTLPSRKCSAINVY